MKTNSFSSIPAITFWILFLRQSYLNLIINVLYEKKQKMKNNNIFSKYYTQPNIYISLSYDQIV